MTRHLLHFYDEFTNYVLELLEHDPAVIIYFRDL